MEQIYLQQVRQAIDALPSQPNVSLLTADEVKRRAEEFGTRTSLGNINFVSTVKNLSTALTVYLGSEKVETGAYTQKKRDIRKGASDTIRLVHSYLKSAPLVQLDATMGEHSQFTPGCRLYLSTYRKEAIRLAHKVCRTLFPAQPPGGFRTEAPKHPDSEITVVVIPEWQEKERQILVFPEIGVTYILGSDFYGEIKNAFLRMAMWQAKQQGMLGLHAGTKILHARSAEGDLRRVGMIMFGIAATGKTTHSCHDHGLDQPGEGVEIVQDDVVFWRNDGSALGSERAFYIKTDGLSPEDQPLLYHSATQDDAILENVMVDFEGNVDFSNRTLTANGHAIGQRSALGACVSDTINLPPLDQLDSLIMAFMVRSYTVVPIVSKLTPEQAAAAFMLSEPIDASGSDQQAPAGIGSSPFVIGDASEDCNMFLELLKAHSDKIQCYMLNTGGVGEIVEHGMDGARKVRQRVTRVQIPEMAAVIRAIARDEVTWREDSNWMVETPESIDGVDMSRFALDKHYTQPKIDSLMASIRLERAEYARQFEGLSEEVRQAVEF